MADYSFVYTGEDLKGKNWFYEKYYYAGSNSRYFTFQMCLNILNQKVDKPVIIETGCQRQEDDLGGGMSTSIFAEYISRYGGKLITVDLIGEHLRRAQSYLTKWPSVDVQFVESDSVAFLSRYNGPCDLLYLDSFDFPYGELLDIYGGRTDIQKAMDYLKSLGRDEIIRRHSDIIMPCQQHTVNEFRAIEDRLSDKCVVLIDDNMLSAGGKPRLLKDYLASKGWVNVLDFQQSMWMRL